MNREFADTSGGSITPELHQQLLRLHCEQPLTAAAAAERCGITLLQFTAWLKEQRTRDDLAALRYSADNSMHLFLGQQRLAAIVKLLEICNEGKGETARRASKDLLMFNVMPPPRPETEHPTSRPQRPAWSPQPGTLEADIMQQMDQSIRELLLPPKKPAAPGSVASAAVSPGAAGAPGGSRNAKASTAAKAMGIALLMLAACFNSVGSDSRTIGPDTEIVLIAAGHLRSGIAPAWSAERTLHSGDLCAQVCTTIGNEMTQTHRNLPRRYMDNAATSFPKPPAVTDAMLHFATSIGASPGRGSYEESREASALLALCRRRINRLINGQNPDHVIFTLNCSDALNMAIRGIVFTKSGPRHLITTDLDHNSVLRPFNELSRDPQIEQTRLKCDPVTGLADPDDLRRAIRPETCLIAIAHASNVTGTLQRIAEFGAIARDHDIPLLVDAAQSAGHVSIDVQAMNIDLLAAPGHKGLLGPLGTGFLYVHPGVERRMVTYREGGTGSISEQDTQPDFMPDRFEPGSHNTIGLLGLSEGVQYLLDRGMDDAQRHSELLIRTFLDALAAADTPGLHLYGPPTAADRVGVFSIRIDGFDDPQALSDVLEREHAILTRSGLHCAPGAHTTIGTLPLGGTTRLSFGPFTTIEDARYAAEVIAKVCQHHAAATTG